MKFQFFSKIIGEKKSKFLILSSSSLEDIEVIPGTRVLISAAQKSELINLLKKEEGAILAERWGVSPNLIWRLRSALGIAKKYSGDSPTTQWRKRK